MGENTKIEWATHTFNGWVGCEKVSPACDNCYAENWAKRTGQAELWQGSRRLTSDANWRAPLRWNKQALELGERQRVFGPSLADPFDNVVPATWRAKYAALIRECSGLDWLLLTKRIGNAAHMLEEMFPEGLPSNLWLGATICNQAEANRDLDKLAAIEVACRFVSIEPMLSFVSLYEWLPAIDWVIAGGESGAHARPSNPLWFRFLREQCKDAGVAFLFKQWGEWHFARSKPAGTRGHYALMPRDFDSALAPIYLDEFPREFTKFGQYLSERVGKKEAGRVLDGVTHDALPDVRMKPIPGHEGEHWFDANRFSPHPARLIDYKVREDDTAALFTGYSVLPKDAPAMVAWRYADRRG